MVARLSLDRIGRHRGPHPYWVETVEAADVLGVTPVKLRRLAAVEKVPGVLHRRRCYFRRHQLDVVVNAREAREWAGVT